MTQANRNLVADALESGEFAQGKGALCRDGKYCCLGVACEIYQRVVGDLVVVNITVVGTPLDRVYDGEEAILPRRVMDWLGFKNYNGSFEPGSKKWCSLTELNDDGTPFTEIAKLFRNPPKGLVNESSKS